MIVILSLPLVPPSQGGESLPDLPRHRTCVQETVMASSSLLLKLHVRNEKGQDELVDTVKCIVPPQTPADPVMEIAASKIPPENKISVTRYTRDDAILYPTSASSFYKFRMLSAGKDGAKKLIGFGSYLRERKKAAVFKLNNLHECYIVPPTADRNIETMGLSCLSKHSILEKAASSNQAATATTALSSSTSPSSSSKPSKTAVGPPGLLSSILSKIPDQKNSTDTIAAKEIRERKARDEYIRSFEVKIKAQLDEFLDDETQTQLEFDPMEHDLRYYCHYAAEDYDSLISASIGEDENRHVVVYKKGHEPADLFAQDIPQGYRVLLGAALTGGRRQKKEEAAVPAHIAASAMGGLHKTNQIKRDRRTIEEIQADMKRSKNS